MDREAEIPVEKPSSNGRAFKPGKLETGSIPSSEFFLPCEMKGSGEEGGRDAIARCKIENCAHGSPIII